MEEKLKKAKIIFVVGQAWLRKGQPVQEDCAEIWLHLPTTKDLQAGVSSELERVKMLVSIVEKG